MTLLHKTSAKISAAFFLASATIFAFCYLSSGGSGDENGSGAVWWLFALVGIPCAFAGVISLFVALTQSKTVKIGGKNYGLGSVSVLAILLAILIYIFVH